jgi:uncharacterized protein YbjQ (UPF0145 family)
VIKPKYVLLIVSALWLIGCTPYQATLTNDERSYPATTAEHVQIFLQGETTPAATEIGQIVVNEKSEEDGVKYLQKKAAEMGADGVINVEVQVQTHVLLVLIIPIPIHSYFVSGTAIKWANQHSGLLP